MPTRLRQNGGAGVHTVWEAEARFDYFEVIPEPAASAVFVGLITLAGTAVLRRQR